MLRLDVLRHGETALSNTLRGSTDDALTSKGWKTMQQTVNTALDHGLQWDMILSSPLQRCLNFAQDFSGEQQLPLYIDAQFQEMHFGTWEAASTQTLYAEYPEDLAKFWTTPTQFTPPQAEALFDFQQRVVQGLKDFIQYLQVKNTNQPKRILLVTHGGVIKLLKVMAQQQPLDDILKMSADLGQLSSFQLHLDGSVTMQEQQ
ncbi:histidine phosphatase family protein [Acinetobacter towneri]|uniref:histidine phosphatase family protein n=1 Tax=Acinetobacter towneri TaxID=202956 RepID=UPI00188D834F|nr:histidine phosphatase family protein [Acinetobacter towneri]MBF4520843.1 histidine phosphatase family protein [Acinetobacter towneri]